MKKPKKKCRSATVECTPLCPACLENADPPSPESKMPKAKVLELLRGARGIISRNESAMEEQYDELLRVRAQVRDEISARDKAQKAVKEKDALLARYEDTIQILSALLAAKPRKQEFELKMSWGNESKPASAVVEMCPEDEPL